MRVPLRRTEPFVITADSVVGASKHLDTTKLERIVRPRSEQLDLFETAQSARSGEL